MMQKAKGKGKGGRKFPKRKIFLAFFLLLLFFCAGCGAAKGKDASIRVFLVRHGQTDANVQSILAGSGTDSPLNDTGIQQAKDLGKAFADAGITFDQAYSSQMQRAQNTASYILQETGQESMPVVGMSEFNDLSWGSLEGAPIAQAQSQYGTAFEDYLADDGSGASGRSVSSEAQNPSGGNVSAGSQDPSGGSASADAQASSDESASSDADNPFGAENKAEYLKRFQEGMDSVVKAAQDKKDTKNILVVTHSAAVYWLKQQFDNAPDGLDNASVTILEYKDGKWTLVDGNITGYSRLQDDIKDE